MQDMMALREISRSWAVRAFTVIELLVLLAVVAILAALILGASIDTPSRGPRIRAASEIQAMSTALEGYKTDHGSYPAATNLLTNYPANDATHIGNYQISSQILYRALSGQTNFTDRPVAETRAYMNFKRNQVGDAAGGSFVKDPSGNSYGYSTGKGTSNPYNGQGYFDLWSTAGKTGVSASETNVWISNWQ